MCDTFPLAPHRRLWSARTCPRFRQATCRRRAQTASPSFFQGPLDAARLWRQVAKVVKAVTSHRTPKLCRQCMKFHHCITGGSDARGHFIATRYVQACEKHMRRAILPSTVRPETRIEAGALCGWYCGHVTHSTDSIFRRVGAAVSSVKPAGAPGRRTAFAGS